MIKGEVWSEYTSYEVGDYVYPTTPNGYFYICTVAGKSQSYSFGKSSEFEPVWLINSDVLDGILVWKFVEAFGTEVEWTQNTVYGLGNRIKPTTGFINWNGKDYCYELKRVVAEPDWITKINKTLIDNEVTWECRLATRTFIPKGIADEPVMAEVGKIIDYLFQLEGIELNLNEVLHKHKDRLKLKTDSIYSIISEMGYDYIANIFNLTKDEVSALLSYTSLLHILKGSRSGLELALDLMNLSYHIEEWWEKYPKGVPDTFDLYVNVDMSVVTVDTIKKLIAFVRNYVYPLMSKFNLTYLINFIHANMQMAGFVDTKYFGDVDYFGVLTATLGGFIDKKYFGEWNSGIVYMGMSTPTDELITTPDGEIITIPVAT